MAKAAPGGGGVAGDGLRLIESEGVVTCTYWGWIFLGVEGESQAQILP